MTLATTHRDRIITRGFDWQLIRRGQTGQLHAAFRMGAGRWRTLCGRNYTGKFTVWSARLALRAWDDDNARHCPGCETRINADTRA